MAAAVALRQSALGAPQARALVSAAAAMPVVVMLAVASTPARRAGGVAGCLAGPHVGCLAVGGAAGGAAAALADDRARAFLLQLLQCLA